MTLSLPSAEEKLASDVVFVMDDSTSANSNARKEALKLLTDLKSSEKESGATINVCVVQFNRKATISDWFDLSTQITDIETAMDNTSGGGTNIHAGLLAGKEALEEHSNVSVSRKYLILVSDGSTYLYSKDGNWASDTPFTRSYYTKENYEALLADLTIRDSTAQAMAEQATTREMLPDQQIRLMLLQGKHTLPM